MKNHPEFYWLTQNARNIPPSRDDAWLVENELEKLEQLRYTKRRADWRLGRWTAKRAVCLFLEETGRARQLSSGEAECLRLEIVPDHNGAPEVYVGGRKAGFNISISHSGGMGFCVVSGDGYDIGCDVEKVENRSGRFVTDYFTEEEKRAVEKAGEDKSPATTLIWSAKESALKALRKGLVRDTRGVRVQLTAIDWGENRDAWDRLSVTCDETGRTFTGWWRMCDGFVFTIAAGAADGMLKRLVPNPEGEAR